MVKQSKTRRASKAAPAAEFNRRDLFLAGLGAVSLTRKRGIELVGSLRDESRSLRDRAGHLAANLQSQFNGGVHAARARFNAVVVPLRTRAEATLQKLSERAPAQLREVLARFGLTSAVRRAPAKRGAVRKAAAKRAARKAPSRRRAA